MTENTTGYTRGTGNIVQGIFLDGPNIEISGNVAVNERGKSHTEDLISMYQAHGTKDSPIHIANNKFYGGGCDTCRSNAGIQLGDEGGAYQIAENNLIVNPGWEGLGMAGGHDIAYKNNKVYSGPDSYPAGVGFTAAPPYDPDTGECRNQTFEGNQITYYQTSENDGTPRPDPFLFPYWVPDRGAGSGCSFAGWNDGNGNTNVADSDKSQPTTLDESIWDPAWNEPTMLQCDGSGSGSASGGGAGGPIPTSQGAILTDDFESDNWADKYQYVISNVTRETGVAAHSGDYGIHMHVNAGELWGGEILYDLPQGNQTEIWTRYYIRYDDNWSRDDFRGGKAGFRSRSDEVCGAPCLEMTDQFFFRNDGSGDIYGQSYFHQNVGTDDLASNSFEYRGKDWTSGDRQRGQWYCVEDHHVLNTPGKDNGVDQQWLDGQLVSDVQSANQRDASGGSFNIDKASLITYIGGNWGADHAMDVYFDDWAVSDQRIGCN